MAAATRTVRVKFDGSAKGLIAAAAKAGIAVEGFEKQIKKSAAVPAASIGGGLIDALGALPSVLKGAAITAGAGIGVVMAPALAAAIISGVLLAVGGGVLAAGIIGAAKSPKVTKAWQKFGRQATVVFERFSKPFIKPLEKAARTFGAALAKAEPTIRRIGATMAPIIDKLAPAFAGLAEQALPGILAATQASVGLFGVLSDHLPGIGIATSQFFEAIAAGSPAAQVFFGRFLGWIESLLPKTGEFLTWLANLGLKMDQVAKGPELAGLKSALIDLKDNTLTGVKTILDGIKTSLSENSETWKHMAVDIEGAIRLIGPAVKWVAEQVDLNVKASVKGFALMYEAIRKVVIMIDALVSSYSRLPGNLSGNGTNVQFGKIPGRAYGGPVTAGRTYMVGEREAELFTPRQSGYIKPMSQVDAASSGGQPPIIVENHIEIGGEVVRVVRTEIRENNRSVRRGVAMAGAR